MVVDSHIYNKAKKEILDIASALDAGSKVRAVGALFDSVCEHRGKKILRYRTEQEDATEFLNGALDILYKFDSDSKDPRSNLHGPMRQKTVSTARQNPEKYKQAVGEEGSSHLILSMEGLSDSISSYFTHHCQDDDIEGKELEHNEYGGSFKVPATKSTNISLVRDAKEIVVSVKRFNVENTKISKINRKVAFDEIDIDIQDSKEKAHLKPTAYIIHGGDVGGGHYIAIAQEEDSKGNVAWYQYNDSFCSKISDERAVELAADAYVAKYSVVKNGKVNLPIRDGRAGSYNQGNTCWANSVAAFLASFTSFVDNDQVLEEQKKKKKVNASSRVDEVVIVGKEKNKKTSKPTQQAVSSLISDVDSNQVLKEQKNKKKVNASSRSDEVVNAGKTTLTGEETKKKKSSSLLKRGKPTQQAVLSLNDDDSTDSEMSDFKDFDWEGFLSNLSNKDSDSVVSKTVQNEREDDESDVTSVMTDSEEEDLESDVDSKDEIESDSELEEEIDSDSELEEELSVVSKNDDFFKEEIRAKEIEVFDFEESKTFSQFEVDDEKRMLRYGGKIDKKTQALVQHEKTHQDEVMVNKTANALDKYLAIVNGFDDEDYNLSKGGLALKVWNDKSMTTLDRRMLVELYNKNSDSSQQIDFMNLYKPTSVAKIAQIKVDGVGYKLDVTGGAMDKIAKILDHVGNHASKHPSSVVKDPISERLVNKSLSK